MSRPFLNLYGSFQSYATILETKIPRQSLRLWEHPFNAGLAQGTLPTHYFFQFCIQDTHYLKIFSEFFSHLSEKTIKNDAQLGQFLKEMGQGAAMEISRIRDTHAYLKTNHDDSLPEIQEWPPSQEEYPLNEATQAYINHLKCHQEKELPIAMAAVFPCLWLYAKMGPKLLENMPVTSSCYSQWIAPYADLEFLALVKKMEGIMNRLAEEATPKRAAKMYRASITSSHLEINFLNAIMEPKPSSQNQHRR